MVVMAMDKQLKAIEAGVDILIGTTGRVIDYVKQRDYPFR